MNGFLNILKPPGMTSAAVVGYVRRMTGEKRVGHAGTLDPEAAGVLPIMIGRAARLFDYLVDKEKTYVAECAFGAATDTQDATGKIIATGENYPDFSAVQEAAEHLVGDIEQRPSIFSAIKQDGKRLYELAREGKTVERKPRMVTIDAIVIESFDLENKKFSMRVRCSKGTYIRTLCRDIGERLGCFAHMSALCRTQSGRFRIEDAYTLPEIEAMTAAGDTSFLTPVDRVFDTLPALYLSARKAQKMCNGVRVSTPGMEEGRTYRVYDEKGCFLTVSKAENGVLKIEKTFYQG